MEWVKPKTLLYLSWLKASKYRIIRIDAQGNVYSCLVETQPGFDLVFHPEESISHDNEMGTTKEKHLGKKIVEDPKQDISDCLVSIMDEVGCAAPDLNKIQLWALTAAKKLAQLK